MKRWVWIVLVCLVLLVGGMGYLWVGGDRVDAVTSASIRIITPGERDITQKRELRQEPEKDPWVDITSIVFTKEWTEYGGVRVRFDYDLAGEDITGRTPVYIFIRYKEDDDASWRRIPLHFLTGNGHGIVERAGHKTSYWWGTYELAFDNFQKTEFCVRGIPMSRVPAGEFVMRSLPGAGRDDTREHERVSELPTYYMMRYETTIRQYVDYLNEIADEEVGWNPVMEEDSVCGIKRHKPFLGRPHFSADSSRMDHPVTQISWYDAVGFLEWCGLRLPTEAQFEKAFRGGRYLDGNPPGEKPNPYPERTYPWGNELPDQDGEYRCNAYGEEDGYPFTAPVGSFEGYNSPYDIADLAGNVYEWTLDWYTTSYHVGLDGYRMVRGGSWVEFPLVVDAISGATKSPVLESGVVGFRGVYNPPARPDG